MELPIFLILILGISLLVSSVYYFFKARKLQQDLTKMEIRKEKYKERLREATVELIDSELGRLSAETETATLKNQKLRAWDIPDGM